MSDTIEAVKERHEATLLSLPNVVGIGIGFRRGAKVIKAYVVKKAPLSSLAPEDVVPHRLNGYEVDVEEIGAPTAQR